MIEVVLNLSAEALVREVRRPRALRVYPEDGQSDPFGIEVLRRRQHLRNYSLLTPDALEQLVHVVQRFTGKVNLGHEPVRAAGHVEMDVRWPGPSLNAGWISTRFDCLEPEAAFYIRALCGETVEVRIEGRRIGIARMRVASVHVGLPDLHLNARNGITFLS